MDYDFKVLVNHFSCFMSTPINKWPNGVTLPWYVLIGFDKVSNKTNFLFLESEEQHSSSYTLFTGIYFVVYSDFIWTQPFQPFPLWTINYIYFFLIHTVQPPINLSESLTVDDVHMMSSDAAKCFYSKNYFSDVFSTSWFCFWNMLRELYFTQAVWALQSFTVKRRSAGLRHMTYLL